MLNILRQKIHITLPLGSECRVLILLNQVLNEVDTTYFTIDTKDEKETKI